MKKLYLFLLIPIFALALLSANADDPAEMRAFYAATYDINTQTKCDNIISDILARNVNAVFVEVRGRADAYYYPNRDDSTYPNSEPRGELYSISPAGFDNLQYFIDKLHSASKKIEVHAWCTTFNTWNRSTPPVSSAHVYNAHPEWITYNKAGTKYTYTDDAPLDPGIPAVQDYLFNVFTDIVRNYDVDGIHFDYVRLLGTDSGYNPLAKAAFKNQTGFDFDTDNGSGQLDEVYEAWRRDQISKVVQKVHTYTMLEKPWVEVSAFLVNFDDSVESLGQGYNWWAAHNAIDVLHPGCYGSSVASTVADWDFYVSKLTQNGDQNKLPLVCAVGDYLLTDTNENADAVTTLRTNSRKPDGYNFFDYGSLFHDAGTTPTIHADNLFNPGGPMDDWAPLPAIPNKTDEETTPPNAPASAAVAIVSNAPQITFSRPAAASDTDLPVHYRLYRDTKTPVDLFYDNMIMEWWDLSSTRSSFSYDDVEAGASTYYYAIVAYDNWNNQAVSTVGPITPTSEIIVDDGDSGFSSTGTWNYSASSYGNDGDYLWADAGGTAATARWTPTITTAGNYEVYVWYRYGGNRTDNAPYTVNYNGGSQTYTINQQTNASDWVLLGTHSFAAGTAGYVGLTDTCNPSVVIADAVRFKYVLPARVAKEAKPAVSEPASSAVEVIADSTPQALDYDDNGTIWTNTTYSGYYNGNARYYPTASYPFTNYAVWLVDLPSAGSWVIEGWTRHNTAFAQGAQYRFVDSSGTVRSTTVSQRSTYDSTTAGDWLINIDGVNEAGAYTFNKGHNYVIVYGNTTGSQIVIADAIRFRKSGSAVNNWEIYK